MADIKLYQEQHNNMRARSSASAMKAVDYMDGDIRPHLETLLSTSGYGIKNWDERGVIPIWVNLVGRIIEKSALNYQEQPTRKILNSDGSDNPDATEAYEGILKAGQFHTTAIDADQITRLLKTALYLIQYVTDEETGESRYIFDVLSQHNSDLIYDKATGKISSLLYASGSIGPDGGQIYYHWTDDEILELELVNEVLSPTKITPEENTYGFIPVAKYFDVKPPRSGIWAKPVYEQLVYLTDAISLFNTEVKHNSRFGTIGSPVTNMEVPPDTVINVDAILELITNDPEVTPFFEYRIPPANVEEFKSWARDLTEEVGMDWGVNLKLAGEGTAESGFQLVVEELPTLTLWKKRQPMAVDSELDVYSVVRRIDKEVGEDVLPEDATLSVEFHAPELPVNKKEAWEIAQGELALGVLTKRDYIAGKFPTWTDDQIDKYLADIAAEKGAGVSLDLDLEDEDGLGVSADPAEAVDPQTALNGAQVTAMLEIVTKVLIGELDKETAAKLIAAAFPLSEEEAAELLSDVKTGGLKAAAAGDVDVGL